MAATAEQGERLRRMVGEVGSTTYQYTDLAAYIERYPLEDARGEGPWVESTTTPGTLEENPDWTATYDLNAAAADVWSEKAAALAGSYDFSADGASRNVSQKMQNAERMARYYRSRRAITTVTQRPEPLYQGTESVND